VSDLRAIAPTPAVEPSEYLTTGEVGRRLRWSRRTMRAKIASGFFVEGREFFQPAGCQPRWKWSAVVARLEGRHPAVVDGDTVKLARGGGRQLL
jgi:hypothetical protein